MGKTAKKHGEILYPQSEGSVNGGNLIAFGRVHRKVKLSGTLVSQITGTITQGTSVRCEPSKEAPHRNFWALSFQVNQVQANEKYMLWIADKTDGRLLACSVNLDLAAQPSKESGPVNIGYPHEGDDPIPVEFIASGTAPQAGGDVHGTMSNCDQVDSVILQIQKPPNWLLYCDIVDPNPPCTLTVKQGTNGDASGGLTFGTD
jgi:hypothetical protein